MFGSILIANRGEIAVRVARTARRLGLRTIAIFSQADAKALHTKVCDEAHLIGPPSAQESYLAIDKIIAIARRTKAECIHPGYGFLAENAEFAEACARAGIVFVGPPAHAIRAMGMKDRAKALMANAGVPIVPGYHGERQDPAFLKQKAEEIGYPLLIKPVAGGGGKGMRRVDRRADFDAALEGSRREAQAAFADTGVLIEKYVAAPRHIEVQVFADTHGSVIHLNERDCSLQRRHQKVIEEAPAPGVTASLRETMGRAAVTAARAAGYVGAGTVEFIADGSKELATDRFWFVEMNTRLQVEHPVTEAVTGLDLVEWQLRVAAGERLPLAQQQVRFDGHAIEARLYAEDPEREFLPSTGTVLAFEMPAGEGIRVDAGIAAGLQVTPFYDPLIAKIIAHAPTRAQALDRLAGALDRTIVIGPRTNTALLATLVRAREFRAGEFDTNFIESKLSLLVGSHQPDRAAAAFALATYLASERARISVSENQASPSPWDADDGFQLSGARMVAWPILVDYAPMIAQVAYGTDGPRVSVEGVGPAEDASLVEADDAIYVLRGGRQTLVRFPEIAAHEAGDEMGGIVAAPMHGKVLAVLVQEGDDVRKGQRLAIIEAMKMEHALLAPIDGTVAKVAVAAGAQVAEKAIVLVIGPKS